MNMIEIKTGITAITSADTLIIFESLKEYDEWISDKENKKKLVAMYSTPGGLIQHLKDSQDSG
ncbi:hypothetical protein KAU43_06335 [candidate division WOR-3 bacterium]|nr:hypothetical protein [candidate division WOR-3 bacterium]